MYFSVHGRAVGVASLEALTSMGGRAMPSALRDGTCDLAANKTYQLFQCGHSERVSHATAGAGRATRQGLARASSNEKRSPTCVELYTVIRMSM